MTGSAKPKQTGVCPVLHTDYRPDRPVFGHYQSLNREREESPFYWNDSTRDGFWMVTRYDHVVEALGMHEAFSNRQTNAFDKNMQLKLLPQMLDAPEHRKLRAILNPFFSPPAVKRMQELAQERARALIAALKPHKQVDFVTEFAMLYPTEIFLALLGLPTSDGQMFLEWVEAVFDGFFKSDPQSQANAASSAAKIMDYFKVAVADREKNPGNPRTDLVTRLLQAHIDDKPIPREDVLTICLTLMAAGLDTTRSALGYIFHHLARRPEDRRSLMANPDSLLPAIDEFIRLYSLIIQDGRQATRDIDFHGCPIKAGDMLWLGLASANRDPRKFERPDEFIMNRPNINDHVGFGWGTHRCLGMHLARAELVIALREWHEQIPEYRIAESAPELMERGGQLRLQHLPLVWD